MKYVTTADRTFSAPRSDHEGHVDILLTQSRDFTKLGKVAIITQIVLS